MKASISLLLVLFDLTTGLIRDHIFVNILMNWTDAQSYCRERYTDMSTIQSEDELQMLLGLQKTPMVRTWIGLYRDINNGNFRWSDGTSLSFSNWDTNEPNNYGNNQYCVSIEVLWSDSECYKSYKLYCYKLFILIKEKMTWEEALEYCRVHQTDLASVTTERQIQLIKNESVGSQTESVWTGLRFLAGEWFWVDGNPLGDQVTLPECPAQPARCGARNTKTDQWENRDCDEKLNFLCN